MTNFAYWLMFFVGWSLASFGLGVLLGLVIGRYKKVGGNDKEQ